MIAKNLLPVPELYAPFDRADDLKQEATELASWDLTPPPTVRFRNADEWWVLSIGRFFK